MYCEVMDARKRKLDECEVYEMKESEGAIIHGVGTQLSPVKVSRRNPPVRYYDGNFYEQEGARIVSFDPSLRAAMEAARVSGSTVSVVNYQVKAAKSGEEMEIMATSCTKVEPSPRKFVI